MSSYSNTTAVYISETDIHAPLIGYGEFAAEKFKRMGVMNEEGELSDDSIAVLAATFASNFYDRIWEYYSIDELEAADTINYAIIELWKRKETISMYYYLVFCCGMIECPVPKELSWIAQRDDALIVYMQKFINTLQKFYVE